MCTCVVGPACHCILNWSLQMRICNCIGRVQAPAPPTPPTQPATTNRPAQLPMPLRCRLCSPAGCRGPGGPGAKGAAGPGGCTAHTALPGLARPGFVRGVPAGGILAALSCHAIPVVPPRPVSAAHAATEYRSTEFPARKIMTKISQ